MSKNAVSQDTIDAGFPWYDASGIIKFQSAVHVANDRKQEAQAKLKKPA